MAGYFPSGRIYYRHKSTHGLASALLIEKPQNNLVVCEFYVILALNTVGKLRSKFSDVSNMTTM
jgi:hypothetical protein